MKSILILYVVKLHFVLTIILQDPKVIKESIKMISGRTFTYVDPSKGLKRLFNKFKLQRWGGKRDSLIGCMHA